MASLISASAAANCEREEEEEGVEKEEDRGGWLDIMKLKCLARDARPQ